MLALELNAQAQRGHVEQKHVLRHARGEVLATTAAALLQNAALFRRKRKKKKERKGKMRKMARIIGNRENSKIT